MGQRVLTHDPCDPSRFVFFLHRATASTSSDAADVVAKVDAAKAAWLNQRRVYRQLRHTKSAEYWNDMVEANQSDPHKLWQLVDDLLELSCRHRGFQLVFC